jgi:taurine dioxygenase
MTMMIKGLDLRESNYLLQYLLNHLRNPEFRCRHKWCKNDLAIWGNRRSLHHALFYYTGRRMMRRIVIKGDKPV